MEKLISILKTIILEKLLAKFIVIPQTINFSVKKIQENSKIMPIINI